MAKAGSRSRGLMWWVIAVYGALALAAAAYAFYRGNFARANSEFSGVPLMLLALPWSWWFRDFNPRLVQSEFNNTLLVTSGYAGLNLLLLFLIGLAMHRRRRTL